MRTVHPDHSKPLVGETWAEAKAFWFKILGYGIYADEVRAMHAETCPLIITSAPARTSKSYSGAFDMWVYGMPTRPLEDALLWSVGPRYETNKEFDYWYHLLVDRREELRAHGAPLNITRALNSPGQGNMEIVVEWGKGEDNRVKRSVFKGMTATNDKSLQGEEGTGAIMSEAAEQDASIYEKYLATRCGRILMPTTPKPHADWIRKLKDQVEVPGLEIRNDAGEVITGADGQPTAHRNPDLGIAHFTFPPDANPNYDHARFERERTKAEIRARESYGVHATAEDDPMFAEQFLGRWVYYTGTVLPFNARRHVIPVDVEQCRKSKTFISCDYGYKDPAVAHFWAISPTGELVIYREVYERGLTSQDFVAKILAEADHMTDLQYATGDPAEPQVAHIMNDYGLPIVTINTREQKSRAASTRRLTDWLTEGPYQVQGSPTRPGLYLSSECVHTAHEWSVLRWKERHSGNEYSHTAMEGEDHAFDSARYGIMTRPEPGDPVVEDRDWLKAERDKYSPRAMRRYFPESGGRSAWA